MAVCWFIRRCVVSGKLRSAFWPLVVRTPYWLKSFCPFLPLATFWCGGWTASPFWIQYTEATAAAAVRLCAERLSDGTPAWAERGTSERIRVAIVTRTATAERARILTPPPRIGTALFRNACAIPVDTCYRTPYSRPWMMSRIAGHGFCRLTLRV